MHFEGIYSPVITPFNPDYSINREGYARVIESQIDLGIHGPDPLPAGEYLQFRA
jgi:4-hydroxy-tetrahydrodipicolinate synthase